MSCNAKHVNAKRLHNFLTFSRTELEIFYNCRTSFLILDSYRDLFITGKFAATKVTVYGLLYIVSGERKARRVGGI
jgi:hypothetical protein